MMTKTPQQLKKDSILGAVNTAGTAERGESNSKRFVLDKSVVLFSPYSILAFDDNEVFLPYSVIRDVERAAELERGEVRANAKEFGVLLDELRMKGSLQKGISLDNGGSLTIVGDSEEQRPIEFIKKYQNYTLVTRDPFVRVEANICGIRAEDYRSDQAPTGNGSYEGRCCLFVSSEEMQSYHKNKRLELSKSRYAAVRMDGETLISDDYKPTINEYIILKDASNPKKATMLGRFNGKAIVPLLYYPGKERGPVYGVEPRNVGQIFALDALLAPPEVAPLVILKGPAGTGKTFLAMAAALAQTIDNWGGKEGIRYNHILLTRPNTKMDEDIGYLKGTEHDKVMPALRGLIDNIDNLSHSKDTPEWETKDGIPVGSVFDELLGRGTIDAQALAYMRGRSINQQYIVCDEMQNATIMQTLSIVTRTGDRSKIVLCGDPEQIDHPLLDQRTNGISFAAERMRGSDTTWQLTFTEAECERSRLAAEAIKRMKPKGAT